MNPTVLKSLAGLLPILALFLGATVLVCRKKRACYVLQWLGSTCLLIVVLAHIAEGLRLLPGMGWGMANSAGHYLDLCSAILGATLFPAGYLWQSFQNG